MKRTMTFSCSAIPPLDASTSLSRVTHTQLQHAYDLCESIARYHSKTFYMGNLLLPPAKRRAVWALYAFCRYADDLVDTATGRYNTLDALNDWENQLLCASDGGDIYHPIYIALADTFQRYGLPLQPARDLIAGVRMDLQRNRYATFDDLYVYCYRVAATVGLLSAKIIGHNTPQALPFAIEMGIAMQLTNILRDIGEDARLDRIYLPQEELEQFGYSEKELLAGEITPDFVRLMDFQIERARTYYNRARQGIKLLNTDGRLSVMASMFFYSKILDQIKRNRYQVFNKRARVSMAKKVAYIPLVMLKLWYLERMPS